MKVMRIKYYIHIYKMIILQDLKSKMSYRFDFIISLFSVVLTNLSGLLTFWLIYQNFPSINGWSYYELLFMYSFTSMALTPAQCLFDNNWNLGKCVYSGDFIKYCFKPLNIFFYFVSEVFDVKGGGQFVFGVIGIIYSWRKLELDFSVIIIFFFLINLCTASLIMIAILNLAAASSFWLVNSTGIMSLAFRIKDFAKYPVTIFNPIFRIIFTFVIPIAFISFLPCLNFLQPENIKLLSILSPLVGLFWFWISYKVWITGALKYNGTGS